MLELEVKPMFKEIELPFVPFVLVTFSLLVLVVSMMLVADEYRPLPPLLQSGVTPQLTPPVPVK